MASAAAPAAAQAAAQAAAPAAAAAQAAGALRVVVQRVTRGRLLQQPPAGSAAAERWAPFGPGLLFFVGFSREAAENAADAADAADRLRPLLRRAARSLLTASLATADSAGGWRPDHGDAAGVADILRQGQSQALVVVPQASLVARLPAGEKYLKYHGQCARGAAEALYYAFLSALREESEALLAKGKPTKAGGAAPRAAPAALTVPPTRLFLDDEAWKTELAGCAFGAFPAELAKELAEATQELGEVGDEGAQGWPVADPSGDPLPKSRLKKLTKALQTHAKKWVKQGGERGAEAARAAMKKEEEEAAAAKEKAEEQQADGAGKVDAAGLADADGSDAPNVPVRLDFANAEADEGAVFPTIVAGTFGGRQGLEVESSGPFTHALTF